MAGSSCCEVCGRPLRFGLMSLQKFLNEMHNKIHILQSEIPQISRYEKRLSNCSFENKEKIEIQFEECKKNLKNIHESFNSDFENPYYQKIAIYYPEIISSFNHFKNKFNQEISKKLG
jgi:hypothetical protein